MESAEFDVSVIIPTFNDNERLGLCLDALMRQECRYRYEVIVVDNGSRVPPVIGANYKNVRLLVENKPGSYSARNAGLKIAKGDVIAFTDSDCIPDQHWLQAAVDRLESQRELGLIAGQVAVFFKDPARPSSVELYDSEFAFRQDENAKRGQAVTANLVVRKLVFDAVGMFNDSTFSGGDYEFTKRAIASGYALGYCAEAVVRHPARDRFEAYRKKIRRTMGGAYTMRKDDPRFARLFDSAEIAKDLLRPAKMLARLMVKVGRKERTLGQVLRIMLVVLHNQWFKVGVKLAYMSNLKQGFQR